MSAQISRWFSGKYLMKHAESDYLHQKLSTDLK